MNQHPYSPIPLPDHKQTSDKASQMASLTFLEFIKKRHSVRHYDQRPVSRAVIENAIEAAGRAPSGAN